MIVVNGCYGPAGLNASAGVAHGAGLAARQQPLWHMSAVCCSNAACTQYPAGNICTNVEAGLLCESQCGQHATVRHSVPQHAGSNGVSKCIL